ncbi:MAG TPA: hypothetical protein ENK96_05935 [Desulfobulbaceae bacterium]|nr:hypothetical protein [Desulfobulbaceae bacterium]
MAIGSVVTSILGTEFFAEYEREVYKKHQALAEAEIVEHLKKLLSDVCFLRILKQFAGISACRFSEYRKINIRLISGQLYEIESPIFRRTESKKKAGRPPKRRKGIMRHLGLELLGFIERISPALLETCVSMAVLCPSFKVAANALHGLGIYMNEHLLQNIVGRFAGVAKKARIECNVSEVWQKAGARILVCVDGGRIRERRIKRGKRKKGLKRQGYSTEWFEPRLLIINQFDETGQKIKSVNPILDGSCGSMDDFFQLLKDYLCSINIEESSEIIFCADGGNGLWPRIDALISDLNLSNARRILDYTHAKQNMSIVKKLISDALKLTDKASRKLAKQIRELLWQGDIHRITELVRKKLSGKKKALNAALKKLNTYFGDHSKFQYKLFRNNGLPTGSGTVESAIRRIINLRVKGSSLFWKRDNAENIIFLRSLVLTGKLRRTCHISSKIALNALNNGGIEN